MVEGKNRNTGLFRSVDVFKGIPFAAQPGRFEKPVPHPGWEGAYTHLACFYTMHIWLEAIREFTAHYHHGFIVLLQVF